MDNHLHAQFHALADPTRLAVVERLLKAPASVSELAQPHDMALPAFTKHLGVLERSGLITSEKIGRVRTCSINPTAMSQLERWFSDRRALWEARLDKLSEHLTRNKKDRPMDIHHETVTLEKSLPASPEDVFRAYTDPKVREMWSAPDDTTEIRILESNVRTGGSETGLCGTRGEELNWRMNVAYHLVEEGKLITFTEELWDGDDMLTIALITFDLINAPDGTTILHLTDQITSFVGKGGVQGHRDGYTKALDNLASMLTKKVA